MDHKDGQWFIVVTCEQCRTMIYLFPDLTNGKSSLNASYEVICPHCHHGGIYDGQHHYQPKSQGSSAGSK